MVLETIVVGKLETNCYLIGDPEALLVIDPGDEAQKILDNISEKGYQVAYVVLTHCHYDHIGAASEVMKKTGAKLLLGAKEKENYYSRKVTMNGYFVPKFEQPDPDGVLSEGEDLIAGSCRFQVLETPGHTSGSICLLCGDVLLSGDTLFADGIGRADFPTGSLPALCNSIIRKLFLLDGNTRVYPGHGPATTIAYEKEHNEVYEWERYC